MSDSGSVSLDSTSAVSACATRPCTVSGRAVGAPLTALTVTVTEADAVLAELSVAMTVSTWVPSVKSSVAIRAVPLAAIWPSRLLVHTRAVSREHAVFGVDAGGI